MLDFINAATAPPISLPVAYMFLAGAVTFETAAATFVRLSDGYTKLWAVGGLVVSYITVFVLAAQAFLVLPLSIGYPIWAGGCAITTGIVGILAFKEKAHAWKFVGIGLVVVGIVILDVLTPDPVA